MACQIASLARQQSPLSGQWVSFDSAKLSRTMAQVDETVSNPMHGYNFGQRGADILLFSHIRLIKY